MEPNREIRVKVDIDAEELAGRLAKMALLISALESRAESLEDRIKKLHQGFAELETGGPRKRGREKDGTATQR